MHFLVMRLLQLLGVHVHLQFAVHADTTCYMYSIDMFFRAFPRTLQCELLLTTV